MRIMGNHYTNITLKGPTQKDIAEFYERNERVGKVSKEENGFVVVYDKATEDFSPNTLGHLARDLSEVFLCPALTISNYDDDILIYELYKEGKKVDDYNSCPNYFEGDIVPPSGGDARKLIEVFGLSLTPEEISAVLLEEKQSEGPELESLLEFQNNPPTDPSKLEEKLAFLQESLGAAFEVMRHEKLFALCGFPSCSVGTGYEYLVTDEIPFGYKDADFIDIGKRAQR
jgi:hypothetical protein